MPLSLHVVAEPGSLLRVAFFCRAGTPPAFCEPLLDFLAARRANPECWSIERFSAFRTAWLRQSGQVVSTVLAMAGIGFTLAVHCRDQSARPVMVRVIHYPHGGGRVVPHRQRASPRRQDFALDDGLDTVRLQMVANQVGLDLVLRRTDPFHCRVSFRQTRRVFCHRFLTTIS